MIPWLFVIGQASNIDKLGQRFRYGGSPVSTTQLVLFAIGFVVLGVGIWVLSRYLNRNEEEACYCPKRMFQALCRHHQLDRADARLLRGVAQHYQLKHGGRVFLEVQFLTNAQQVSAFASNKRQLQSLIKKLFN